MYTPARTRLTIYQGATFDHTYVWEVNGTPVDLTTYTARFAAAEKWTGAPTITLTEGAGITLGADGTVLLEMTAAETAALTPGEYRFDLELEDGTGVVTRLVQGRLTVAAEVS